MMDRDFIKANCKECVYKLKEDTGTSFYWQSGTTMLPNRISLSKEDISATKRTGRNAHLKPAGQMVSTFNKREESPYKIFHPYSCRTKIWLQEQFPLFVGYGTVGITNENGLTKDNGDLLIFYTPDNWHTMRIFVFAGMANPNDMMQAFEYATSVILSEH